MHQFVMVEYDCFVTVILQTMNWALKAKGRDAFDSIPAPHSGIKLWELTLQAFHDLFHHLLGIAKQHRGVVAEEQFVLHPGIA